MSDESQLQVNPKIGDSSLSLSKVRSELIARGLKDAALLVLSEKTCSWPANLRPGGVVDLEGLGKSPGDLDGDVRHVAHLRDIVSIIRYSEPFDHVFCGPERRSIETAQTFGDPIILKGLDSWYRGEFDGRPADLVKGAMRYLILHPDSKPPGVSPISGKPGETYADFLKPLMAVMRELSKVVKTNERILLVTTGGNLEAIDQLAKDGFPAKLDAKNLEAIAECPCWSDAGQLFRLTDKGLEEVRVIPSDAAESVVPLRLCDNEEPGIYLLAAE